MNVRRKPGRPPRGDGARRGSRLATKPCPFCGNPAHSHTVGDAYDLDCSFCETRIELSKTAYAIPCADVDAVLGQVRERMARGARPRIDRGDMQKLVRKHPVSDSMVGVNE